MYSQNIQPTQVSTTSQESLNIKEPNSVKAKLPFVLPRDWPGAGPIDLELHDLPHDSSETEWWYVNGHLDCENGQQYSFFAAFFRVVTEFDNNNNELVHGHGHNVLWSIVDVQGKRYYSNPLWDVKSVDVVRRAILSGAYKMDSHLMAAMLEVLNKGNLPLPDRLASKPAIVQKNKLSLDYDGNIFWKDGQGNYHLFCLSFDKNIELDLHFAPKKEPIRHGNNGVTNLGRNEEDAMFYYFIPRHDVTGHIIIGGNIIQISRGIGWYEHQFGGQISIDSNYSFEKNITESCAWNWFACQLNNGTEITAVVITDSVTGGMIQSVAVIVDPDSVRSEYSDIEFLGEESSVWSSPYTTQDYPQIWNLNIPAADLQLTAHSEFPNQEVITVQANPGFWEGRMIIEGTYQGKKIAGLGFLQRKINSSVSRVQDLLKHSSKQTNSYINQMLPRNPTFENVRDNILASPQNSHYMEGVDLNVIAHSIIHPLRDITDVPGKTWRSFLPLRCMDAVGGDSYRFQNVLAFAEVMHVGSLIIDDIEDDSETRRGVPTIHKTYGNAVAINSGTTAYFVAPHYLLNNTPGLTDTERLFVYEKYFNCCRAAHCGQALDIHGLAYLMPNAVRTRDAGAVLENAIIAIHRLKTAVSVSTMAQVGVFLGGGTSQQVEGFGRYFEHVGIAFQIMDDVFNLTGVPGKTLGEDITAGKVTYPIAKAMKLIDNEEERNWIWSTLEKKPNDQKLVLEVIGKIKKCGALEECKETAADMLERGWKELDPLIPDSMHKIMIRAFGSYVLEL